MFLQAAGFTAVESEIAIASPHKPANVTQAYIHRAIFKGEKEGKALKAFSPDLWREEQQL